MRRLLAAAAAIMYAWFQGRAETVIVFKCEGINTIATRKDFITDESIVCAFSITNKLEQRVSDPIDAVVAGGAGFEHTNKMS